MAAGDIIMSEVVAGAPFFPCGGCAKCHAKFGDTLTWAISGTAACGACYTIELPDSTTKDVKFSITGINGTGTATWDGLRWVATTIGTGTIDVYGTNDGSCGGGITDTGTGNLDLTIACTGDNGIDAVVKGIVTLASGLITFDAFSTATIAYPGPWPNTHASGDCGTTQAPPQSLTFGAFGGTLTLSYP